MIKIVYAIKSYLLVVLLSTAALVTPVHAQSEDLELCPDGFSQGIVTIGSVECYRESSRRSTRQEAELNRLEREAVCNANPNSSVTSSEIFGTSSGGFFSMVTCTVTREIPPGTVLCPDTSEEVYRAFDTLVCQDFGSAADSAEQAQAQLQQQMDECTAVEGSRVLKTNLMENTFDEITFFSSSIACAFTTAVTDIIECPFGFEETDRDENFIKCEVNDRDFETLAEAEQVNQEDQLICTDTTAGLGMVDEESMTGMTSDADFFSLVVCNVGIARYGDFADQTVIRACDTSCTEEIEQVRMCLNGGSAGGPGCIEPASQVIVRRCNTGPDPEGLCPVVVTPTAIVPLLLLDEEED